MILRMTAIWKRAAMRSIASLFGALMLILFAAAPSTHATLAGGETSVAITAQNCEALGHGQTPAGHADHFHCCLVCEWSVRDALTFARFFVIAANEDAIAAPRRPASERPRHPPTGWTTSWSSRAPPRFS